MLCMSPRPAVDLAQAREALVSQHPVGQHLHMLHKGLVGIVGQQGHSMDQAQCNCPVPTITIPCNASYLVLCHI